LNIDSDGVIVIWGAVKRININDSRLLKLNDLYMQIKNPMILFTGALSWNKPQQLKFNYCPINIFQYIAKIDLFAIKNGIRSIVLNKSHKFLFMSSKDYLSRCYILQHLINQGFSEQGFISYKCLQSNRNESYLNDDIKSACATIDHLLPIQGCDTIWYHSIPEDYINQAYLSILTETFYEGPTYFSEKIFQAMFHNHFFIYLGPAHSLKYLKNIGFRTFGHIIDESYDDIEDPVKRLYAVVTSIHNFLSKSIEEIKDLYVANLDIINHNKDLLLATEINDFVVNNIKLAIEDKAKQ
jgi:hypothetical protein